MLRVIVAPSVGRVLEQVRVWGEGEGGGGGGGREGGKERGREEGEEEEREERVGTRCQEFSRVMCEEYV